MIRWAVFGTSLGLLLLAATLGMYVFAAADQNLLANPSFEATQPKDQFGHVFAAWGGWKYEGDCSFEVGLVSHAGKTSALLACSTAGKIRINQPQDLTPGRYRITAYIRGLDIGTGQWNQTTEFMFNEKYFSLSKSGTFGWSRLTYVAELAAPAKTGPSFGLWAPGMFWIDDVSMERVGNDVKLTGSPVIGKEEEAIEPPSPLGPGAVRCSRCRYRNMPRWEKCYACGTPLEEAGDTHTPVSGPPVKIITSFESGNPFNNSTVVPLHATDGQKALRIEEGYAVMQAPQNWSGYDLLKVDTYTDAQRPLPLTIEIQDTGTQGYWTRVNYSTVILPGQSTLILPLKQLYVGEKSRPGRSLILSGITRLVFSVGAAPAAPLFLDKLRLERDSFAEKAFFDGLYAFDFGTGSSPVMDGFTAITPATLYSPGRGYGLKNAKIWRAVDALQPDPLYQDFLCIESGGLAVDVPNGKYRVFVNMDSPAGFWGEEQAFRERSIVAQGKKVVSETMNYKSFAKKYFQFWDQDDLPSENTFDKYGGAHFSEKTFDVNVTNGQISLDFNGENWACSVSAVIIYPLEKAEEGARFLEAVKEKRRFYFDNSFKRVLHRETSDPPAPTAEETQRGYLLFPRDYMQDLYYNDTPSRGELGKPLSAEAFASQEEPVTLAVLPLKDLGKGAITVSALSGPQGVIPAAAIDLGYVSYRINRVTPDGSVYTIAPRLIIPKNSVNLPRGIARQYWLNVRTPATASPGVYTGQVTFTPERGSAASVPLRFTVRKGELAVADIPIGPFGGRIGIPWIANDPETAAFGATMTETSLHALRAKGFTMFSGVPYVTYSGFRDGKPVLDFTAADRQMAVVKALGFLAVSSYGAGLIGLNAYQQDTGKMKAAGFSDYSAFIKAIYTEIQQHAREKDWPTVYWNICDEPEGDALKSAIENAKAYRSAFPTGPPFFTGATSLYDQDQDGLHFMLAKTVPIPALNLHNDAGVKRLRAEGGNWAFYNQGSRWTYGEYLYKAARESDVKYRLTWHWNIVAGDPYYALDCREDDYAWANAAPDGRLVPSVEFLRIAAGLTDYRYLLTLARLAKEKAGSPAAQMAAQVIARRMGAFHLGDGRRSFKPEDWKAFRQEVGSAIEAFY